MSPPRDKREKALEPNEDFVWSSSLTSQLVYSKETPATTPILSRQEAVGRERSDVDTTGSGFQKFRHRSSQRSAMGEGVALVSSWALPKINLVGLDLVSRILDSNCKLRYNCGVKGQADKHIREDGQTSGMAVLGSEILQVPGRGVRRLRD
eukprot:5378241-Ditylum_brightwellii.AAC.1